MPLLSLVASNPKAVLQLTIEQIVATAGDGRLRDNTESQQELREYLRQVTVEVLAGYIDYCLKNSFPKSGQVLQDIVNELGRRLEYEVTNGRYQGTPNAIGFDGVWRDPDGYNLIVEVKTTDAYRLSLDTIASYRDKLIQQQLATERSSILIIVGRTDTGELEAQVRGSRHAWDIRLISIDALISLVKIRESTDGQETIAKVRQLLTPLEYTRLDNLVDVVFTTTKDVESSIATEAGRTPEQAKQDATSTTDATWSFTPAEKIQETKEQIVGELGTKLMLNFIKKSRALYWTVDQKQRVVCTISKRYPNQGPVKYWYAYHPQWHTFLLDGQQGFFVLGCVGLNFAFVLPVDVMKQHLEALHTTTEKNGSGHYYHIKVGESDNNKYFLQLPKTGRVVDLDPYLLQLN